MIFFTGYGWRAAYVISSVPGLIIAILLFVTVTDPKSEPEYYPATRVN